MAGIPDPHHLCSQWTVMNPTTVPADTQKMSHFSELYETILGCLWFGSWFFDKTEIFIRAEPLKLTELWKIKYVNTWPFTSGKKLPWNFDEKNL